MRAFALLALALTASCAGPAAVLTPTERPERPRPVAPIESIKPLGPPTAAELRGPELDVYFVDVGQGDGALIISPTHKIVLIDAGTKKGSRKLTALVRELGIDHVDLAVMSHAHSDHIGGMVSVLTLAPARAFLDPGFNHASSIYTKLLEHLEAAHTRVLIARQGRKIDLGGGAVFEVLFPSEPLLHGTRSDVNSNSIVGALSYGAARILFTGDSEQPTERRVLAESDADVLRASVLKVAHHGGQYSSTAAFLRAVAPRVAVISCGLHNRYGHPTAQALDRLAAAGAAVYRTDTRGTIRLRTDGELVVFETEAAGPDYSFRLGTPPSALTADVRGDPEASGDTRGEDTSASGLSSARGAEVEVAAAATDPADTSPRDVALDDDEPDDDEPDDGELGEDGSRGAVADPTPPRPIPRPTPWVHVPGSPRGLLDINRASVADLARLFSRVRGLGKATAAAIIADREAHGPFASVEDLRRVKGVGPKTVDKLRGLVAVAPPATESL